MREEISTKTAKRKEERVTERRHDCDGTKQSRGTSAQSRNLPGGKQKEANRFHTLATHTKPNRNKTAHLSLSLPPSWIKARLTLMRESRVRGGGSVTKGGKLPRKINPRGLRGLQVPQNTCAAKECLVFSRRKEEEEKKKRPPPTEPSGGSGFKFKVFARFCLFFTRTDGNCPLQTHNWCSVRNFFAVPPQRLGVLS